MPNDGRFHHLEKRSAIERMRINEYIVHLAIIDAAVGIDESGQTEINNK